MIKFSKIKKNSKEINKKFKVNFLVYNSLDLHTIIL